ncbi:candidate exo-beta-1,3-glucanase from glycoside hydrolase family GH5 [Postia placenta Mad-698-R]|nr:candidate exo-beta-1,3-glucanase from glycoside hydrolase family GH5 [Postia placenta Mad-698-R]
MLSLRRISTALSLFSLLAVRGRADNPITPGFPYASEKVHGVNLGGWLLLEPWITPSLFDKTGNDNIVDEWTFSDIAAAGLNHVRLPVGYWAFEVGAGEPYIQGQLFYLESAVNWAANYGVKVIIDLHGAPGSQNGLSYPEWQSNSTNVQRTDSIIKTIISMYADHPDIVPMIAPLNEPTGYDGSAVMDVLTQYYYDSYGNIRPYGSSSQESNTVVLLHDAFLPLSYWSGYMTPQNWQGVAMDTHIYQVFSQAEVEYSYSQHISAACAFASSLSGFDLWLIVGEWSTAPNDCATYLNGRGVGSRYDGTYPGSTYVGSCSGLTGLSASFSSDYKTFLRQYWEAQAIAFSAGAQGWIMWTWKTESADEWSYQAGLAGGWIPQNPTDYDYPNICS